jgi:hypothetical protein
MFVGIDATLLKGQQAFHLAASSNESGGIVFYKTCYRKKVFSDFRKEIYADI